MFLLYSVVKKTKTGTGYDQDIFNDKFIQLYTIQYSIDLNSIVK